MARAQFTLVPVPEWHRHGCVRLGSVNAAEVLRFIEDEQHVELRSYARLRFVAASIVAGLEDDIDIDDCAVKLSHRRSAVVIQRLLNAAMTLSDLYVDRFVYRTRFQQSHIRRFAYQLAADRSILDVDAMLEGMSWPQLQEHIAFSEVESIGTGRMDVRFALLASVVAGSAGAKDMRGQPYTADQFLKALTGGDREKQTAEQMEMYLSAWCDGANRVHAETHGMR